MQSKIIMNARREILSVSLLFAWMFFARQLTVIAMPVDDSQGQSGVTVVRLNPALDKIIPKDAEAEKIADGFHWIEGPVWDRKSRTLFFSDIPANAIYSWKEGKGTKLFLSPSGYDEPEPFSGKEPGSNGLTFDPDGRLVICQHGNRQIIRIEENRAKTVLVDRFKGKRLNSPNDVIFSSTGDMYFTDPPFGLPNTFGDEKKELSFQGVYRLSTNGELDLLIRDLKAPNGLALSPDERMLYVTDVDTGAPAWYECDLDGNGTISRKRLFFDARPLSVNGPGAPDGLKIDTDGNIYGAGPGGIYIFNSMGTLLGIIKTAVATSNCAWGDDGSTLYFTANSSIFRIRLKTNGIGFGHPKIH